ncbi:methyl-CpG-binding domain-containing protein 6-like [Chenopodium quinoa]|uniref:methyl-CpG-binding domain-containing protein 6-like n=1 Tax=Chenopodium quinoa TaxID=63459 RepID=UPI000B7932D8|nr:methyl-CpG-binding domain-containing protein 6-like [Chenopodium quinoa]
MEDFGLFEPDPLLQSGAFIDPNPISSNGVIPPTVDPVAVESPAQIPDEKGGGATSNGSKKKSGKKTAAGDESQPSDCTIVPNPDWLSSDWVVQERVRNSGASKGSRDKYYIEKATKVRLRSKKEVLNYIQTGSSTKRKNKTDDANGSPVPDSATPKRKKAESKAKVSWKNFNFHDAPAKVKWVLSDIYEGTWRPLTNSVERVPESAKQEWSAAFTYLSLPNGSNGALF